MRRSRGCLPRGHKAGRCAKEWDPVAQIGGSMPGPHEGDNMPTIVGYHDITKGQDHWLRSPKRKELFGPLGVTNIRTFVDPQNPKRVAVMMDVPDMDALNAVMQTPGRCRGDGP